MPHPVKVYHYNRCSTCQKALKFLEKFKVNYDSLSITDTPPSAAELKKMLKFLKGDLRRLFNTSGIQYRELGLSSKLETLSEKEAIQLLTQNGKLIRRPFVLGEEFGFVGFQELEWKKQFHA